MTVFAKAEYDEVKHRKLQGRQSVCKEKIPNGNFILSCSKFRVRVFPSHSEKMIFRNG